MRVVLGDSTSIVNQREKQMEVTILVRGNTNEQDGIEVSEMVPERD